MNCYKKKGIIFLVLLLISFVLYAVYPLSLKKINFNQNLNQNPMNIAVIYPKRIKQEALPYHEYECFFEKEREKMHQNFMEEEKKLREEFLKLKKQKKITKKYEAQKEIFQEKIKTLETSLQNKKEIFLQKINKITSDLQDELNRTIKNIVQEESFNIVLNAEADEKLLVLYADESLDITDQVIEKLKSFKYQF